MHRNTQSTIFCFEISIVTVVSLANLHLCGRVSVCQTAEWFTETTSVAEEFAQQLSEPFALKTLLLHHRQLGTLSSGEFNRQDKRNRVLCVFSICVKDQCLKCSVFFLFCFLPAVSPTYLHSVLFSVFDNKFNFFSRNLCSSHNK